MSPIKPPSKPTYAPREGPPQPLRGVVDPANGIATAQDRTDPEQTRALILESRNELQQIYDSWPIMICQLDPRRKVIEANQHFRSFTGWPNDPVALSDKACGVLGCINALEHPQGCGFGPNCKHCALRKALQDTPIPDARTATSNTKPPC